MKYFKKLVQWLDRYFFIIAGILTIISGIYMTTYFINDTFFNKDQSSYQEKYFLYLENGLKNKLFNDEYAKTGFNYYDRESEGSLAKAGYIELLENFTVYLIRSNIKKDSVFQYDYHKALELLQRAKEVEPFASLPNEERRLMDNIQIFIQRNDSLNTLQNLNELKQVILARFKEYQKIESQNSWSLPLAFVGVAFTFIFGKWSIVFSFKKNKNSTSA